MISSTGAVKQACGKGVWRKGATEQDDQTGPWGS